ncbi:MAG: hypothetical protein IJW66_06550 [Clostridia bacterium]|nr:hypothetical protein [Clostridia bacterium]
MGKLSIKNIIIALIIALSLIGTTIFVCVIVLKDDNGGSVEGGGENENPGYVDDGGWTDAE